MAVTLNFNSCSFNKFIKTSPRWRSHMWKRPLLPMTSWRLTNSPSPSYPLPSQVSTHPLDVDASKNSYTLVKVCFVKSLTKASLSLYYQTTKIHKNILKNYFFCWRQSLILPGHAVKGPGFVYYWTVAAGLDTKNRNCSWMFSYLAF